MNSAKKSSYCKISNLSTTLAAFHKTFLPVRLKRNLQKALGTVVRIRPPAKLNFLKIGFNKINML